MNDTKDVIVHEGEQGATLIELLMGIVLMGLVLVGLTAGILTYVRSADTNRYLLSETPELQLVATRFGSDVQSSDSIFTTSGSSPKCGTLPAGAGSTTVVDFTWRDPLTTPSTSDDVDVLVSYTFAPTTHELRRARCAGSSTNVVEQTVLARHIAPSTVVTPAPAATCNVGSCDTTTRQVDLAFYICTANDAGTACLDTAIPGTATGIRRKVL